jgi:hypothetical protein
VVIRKRNEQSKSLVLRKARCKFRKFFDTNKGIRKKSDVKMALANHNLLNRQAQKKKTREEMNPFGSLGVLNLWK